MIVGEAFKRLFSGLTVDIITDSGTITRPVQFHYGDHKELIKWVSLRNQGKQDKYPLIWYVISKHTENQGWIKVTSRMIVLTLTESGYLNTTRSVKSYDGIIDPVWKAAEKLIRQNPYIEVFGKTSEKFEYKDEPNFGVDTDDVRLSQNDFSTNKAVGRKSINTDLVDGRVVTFAFRIKANCIN